ncbi:MAG: pyruvate dehydrogenase (acetyl-transferring) E1 component subunit alpha [Gammaproteobacteria bacterium RIFCSPHIGHO2_12_FULL_42_10]|nr:MAG: pyruvate dehydrogenase (acetyl-transferring) E1 component subunit alpha [Gammaproteobacteria bacterium RIFCSPHIGHO2_12_FULL_42_10]
MVDRFEVSYYQYLDEQSQLSEDAPSLARDWPKLIELYRLMVLARMMDAKAIRLQRTGMLGTYPSTRGQEAVFVGAGYATAKTDIFVPYYRDMAAVMQRGVSLSQILLYWGGDERGNIFQSTSDDFPFSVPVGSQPLHAAGAAFAIKYKKESRAVVAMCGDGATSEGDFYEAMNVAGIWKLPVVFIVCNNQWAISVPRSAQTAAHTLAQKAIAAGFEGEQVDGNDIIAVVHRMQEALKEAREHHTPRLLELICYRQHDHTTADDASRYEPKDLRDAAWQHEPIMRLRKFLAANNVLSETEEQALAADCTDKINTAVAEYQATSPQSADALFDYLYKTLPSCYAEQRLQLINEVERGKP